MARQLTIRVIDDILVDDKGEFHGEDLEQRQGQEGPQGSRRRLQGSQGQVTSGNEGKEYAWPEEWEHVHELSLGAVDNHQGYQQGGPDAIMGAIGNTRMAQMYGQHEDVFDTTAHLISKIQRQQKVVEGNKRTAAAVGLAFLENNGYDTTPVSDSQEKIDYLADLIENMSTNDELIPSLAQYLRENCKPEKTANLFDQDGRGKAFWFDPTDHQVHWGDTHYMIFHKMFGMEHYENQYRERDKEVGVFGWIFPYEADMDYDPEQPGYAIDFGTDFGYGANKQNLQALFNEATDAIEHEIGYPADEVTTGYPDFWNERSAGHAYESDDLSGDGLITCQNCGSQIAGDLCGDCGTENMQWWTQGEGLQHFKGSVKQSIYYENQSYGCFAFLPPMLYLGNRHHMAIMQQLLQHGYTWESLMAARQLWGWCSDNGGGGDYGDNEIGLYLQTDAAVLDKSLLPELEAAFTKLTGKTEFTLKSDQEPTNEEYAPDWDSHYGDEGFYTEVPPVLAFNSATGQKEFWDTASVDLEDKGASWQEDAEFEKLILLDNAWTVRYNNKTSSTWEEQFESPVEENLEDFAQEEGQLTEEQKAAQGVSGPFNINGWTVYERDCNDVYPTHDAIWIDRTNNIILIGYQGHHHDIGANSPFMQSIIGGMDPYNQTAGHFRTEPSKTEPHPAGFLWHGDDATKDEKNVIKQVLKQHYNVDKLKSLYKEIPDAYSEDNDYYEDEEPY